MTGATSSYEAFHPDDLHKEVVSHFPEAPAAVLDIGAGSGRDAAWLVGKGTGGILMSGRRGSAEGGIE